MLHPGGLGKELLLKVEDLMHVGTPSRWSPRDNDEGSHR